MKVIFLDIDGVLNSARFFGAHPGGERALRAGPREACLDRAAVARLNRILQATGAELVLSSSWRARGLARCNDWLEAAGCCRAAFDVTPMGMRSDRVGEISRWRRDRVGEIAGWVAIDDEDISALGVHAVQTFVETGLLEHHVTVAIARLGAA